MLTPDQIAQQTPNLSNPNIFHNGDFSIWQRGTSGSLPINFYHWMADRWVCDVGAVTHAWLQGARPDSSNSPGSLLITGAVGSTGITLRQRIESYKGQDLKGKKLSVTVDLYSNQNLVHAVTPNLRYANTRDGFPATTLVEALPVISIASGWNTYEFTFSELPDSVRNGFEINFSHGPLPSGDTFGIAKAMCTATPIPIPFKNRPVAEELALCQRYYQTVLFNIAGSATVAGAGASQTAMFPTPMRKAPTASVIYIDPEASVSANLNNSDNAVDNVTANGMRQYVTAVAAGSFYVVGYKQTLDAEL